MKRLRGSQLPMFPDADFEARLMLLELPEQHERVKDEPVMYCQATIDFGDEVHRLFSEMAETFRKAQRNGWFSGDNNSNSVS